MFARVSRYRGNADSLRAGFELVVDELEAMEGFAHALFLVDREHGRGMSITLWERREALDATAERAHQMRTRATAPSDSTVESVESYEVVATADPAERAG
jgi:heme-degrading monooxygenase HmoA